MRVSAWGDPECTEVARAAVAGGGDLIVPTANLSPAALSRAQLTSSGLLPWNPQALLLLPSRRVLHPSAVHCAAPRARHPGAQAATGTLGCPRRRTAAPASHAEVRAGGEQRPWS